MCKSQNGDLCYLNVLENYFSPSKMEIVIDIYSSGHIMSCITFQSYNLFFVETITQGILRGITSTILVKKHDIKQFYKEN